MDAEKIIETIVFLFYLVYGILAVLGYRKINRETKDMGPVERDQYWDEIFNSKKSKD